MWSCEEILSYDHVNDWTKVIEQLILIAEELKKINFFNDCFNIITAINNLSIKRLKKTWEKVLQEFMEKNKQLNNLLTTKNLNI